MPEGSYLFLKCVLSPWRPGKGPKTYNNDRGSGCYLSFDLTDGTETVRVVLFNEQVDKFKDLVDESSAIRIENPSVELRDEHYKRFYLL